MVIAKLKPWKLKHTEVPRSHRYVICHGLTIWTRLQPADAASSHSFLGTLDIHRLNVLPWSAHAQTWTILNLWCYHVRKMPSFWSWLQVLPPSCWRSSLHFIVHSCIAKESCSWARRSGDPFSEPRPEQCSISTMHWRFINILGLLALWHISLVDSGPIGMASSPALCLLLQSKSCRMWWLCASLTGTAGERLCSQIFSSVHRPETGFGELSRKSRKPGSRKYQCFSASFLIFSA